MSEYNPQRIEKYWQNYWKQQQTFRTTLDPSKPKYYVLDMFPYPSGAGLHVGHPLGYIATDIISRFKKLQGFNVLHPMGYDAFGLPAEQYALQTGQHPAVTTERNIARYREQLDNLGFAFDWDREVRTCAPDYYKWTQWIFGKLFQHWFDKAQQKARPISELVSLLASEGNANISAASDEETPSLSAQDWNALSEAEQQQFLLHYRLAFLSNTTVNWCPALGTVLANEEVKDGVSERGGYPVIKKQMPQWSLRITAYADRLLAGLDKIDWPEAVKEMQRNWIGRSTGASLRFAVEDHSEKQIEVFTTRIDTVFGVTFLSLAPEHEWVAELTTAEQKESVEAYVTKAINRSERDRQSDVKTVSGVFTGSYALNPFTGERIPIWVADYVLGGYGTGAVMAVPSSDTRDYAFASHFGLPIIPVQEGKGTDITQPDFDAKAGTMINSGFLNGLPVSEALQKATTHAEAQGWGKARITYRLRDAIFSRQRYWGEPFPIHYKDGVPYLLEDSQLPVILPEVDAYKPTETGEPPLGRAKNWVSTEGYPLETNTMPGWAGSSWYFFRYMDAKNESAFASQEALDYWREVDLYLGGAEHATGHLLYARFWTHFLYDLGLVPVDEFAKKLVNQGMIQGVSAILRLSRETHAQGVVQKVWSKGQNAPADYRPVHVDVNLFDGDALKTDAESLTKLRAFLCPDGEDLVLVDASGQEVLISAEGTASVDSFSVVAYQEVEKMSKSKYNVVNPDDLVDHYGADTLRLYEMFLGPLEQSKPWNTNGIEGTAKFLRKFWRLFFDKDGKALFHHEPAPEAAKKVLHKTLKKIAEDIERLSLNTCVSTFMVCVNELTDLKCHSREVLEPLTIALSPFAPHLAEEVWKELGHKQSIYQAQYPEVKSEYLVDDSFECPISINGKVRAKLVFALNKPAQEIEDEVRVSEAVAKWLEGKEIKKVIVVPNRIVNVVLG